MIVLLVRLIFFTISAVSNLISRAIFSATAHFVVLIIQGLRVPGQAAQTGLGHIGEGLKSVLDYIFQLVWEAATSAVSAAFDAVLEAIVGSLTTTGSAVGGLVEQTRNSLEGLLKDLPELGQEVSDLLTTLLSDAWGNYKDALGYVAEHALDS
ncbi:unnamed protein product [Linum trigynum]|uniref:Uncharacterized protein n=1 Tax=Linum trigynum TaxID=586398 RepID=A0AAV2D008_9ROSI